jgi:CubicO group peptidase (beta-lactamase class C family)
MKKIKVFICYALLLFTSCSNKEVTHIPSGSTGEYDFSAVDKLLQDSLGVYNNHVAVLIEKDGAVIYKQEINMSINTNLAIASASKWLSGAVIMSLVDENKLSLDDTVGKFLPIFTQYHKGNITIRQLFSLTDGFATDIGATDFSSRYEYRKDLTLAQAVDSIAVYEPLTDAPGTAFNYKSAGMQIGGRIAEIVSGLSWQDLFNQKIGMPCDMHADYFQMSTSNPLLAGGVHTTAEDYMHFLEMIANKGVYNGTRVLSENAVALMEKDETNGAAIQSAPYNSNPFTEYPVSPVRYGIGNWLDVKDSSGNIVETSSPGMFGTHPWQDSKHHITGIIFTRTTPRKSNITSLMIRQLIRDAVEEKE